MNRFHRAAAGGGAILAVVCTLTACGSSSATTKVSSNCKPAHDVTTIKKGVLSVAAVDYFPVSVTSNGPFKGTEADMMKEFAKENCLAVKVVKVDFAGAIPAVDSGRADTAIGGFYRTAERAKVVGLSDPIYVDRLGVISKTGVSTVDQIRGHKVGTVDGYLWTADAKKVFGSNVSVYPSNVEMKADLDAGRIDMAWTPSAERSSSTARTRASRSKFSSPTTASCRRRNPPRSASRSPAVTRPCRRR